MSVEMLPATWKRSWVKTWRMQHLFTFRDAPEILCLKTNRIILLSVFMSTLTQCIRKTSLFNCSRETNGHCPPKLAFWNKSTRLHIVLDICSFIKIIWHSSSLCKALFEREFFLAFNKSSFYVSRHLEFSYSANLINHLRRSLSLWIFFSSIFGQTIWISCVRKKIQTRKKVLYEENSD